MTSESGDSNARAFRFRQHRYFRPAAYVGAMPQLERRFVARRTGSTAAHVTHASPFSRFRSSRNVRADSCQVDSFEQVDRLDEPVSEPELGGRGIVSQSDATFTSRLERRLNVYIFLLPRENVNQENNIVSLRDF